MILELIRDWFLQLISGQDISLGMKVKTVTPLENRKDTSNGVKFYLGNLAEVV